MIPWDGALARLGRILEGGHVGRTRTKPPSTRNGRTDKPNPASLERCDRFLTGNGRVPFAHD